VGQGRKMFINRRWEVEGRRQEVGELALKKVEGERCYL
jgi:hypothetical protein